ncbi:MAG TPA: hypothetical protein VGS11_00185 [Candidatus Bathyarchaeia archaeon]|nr:hypothetical protein [Candidatus Bathyarchaeia archaeon]
MSVILRMIDLGWATTFTAIVVGKGVARMVQKWSRFSLTESVLRGR